MKELQAGIRFVQAKCIPLNRRPASNKKRPKPAECDRAKSKGKVEQQKPALSPIRSPLKVLRERTIEGWKRLESQAVRINQLSAELEEAMFEFKAIACDVNRDWRAFQATQEPTSAIADICEYQVVNVPNVYQKPSGSFILNSRSIDLFQAEREAQALAQTLRHRTKRKRNKGERR
ncbi:MAG TPA: hypothetical protein V6D11_09770 [Waterburya sp.]|jgi:hypothetical protein